MYPAGTCLLRLFCKNYVGGTFLPNTNVCRLSKSSKLMYSHSHTTLPVQFPFCLQLWQCNVGNNQRCIAHKSTVASALSMRIYYLWYITCILTSEIIILYIKHNPRLGLCKLLSQIINCTYVYTSLWLTLR